VPLGVHVENEEPSAKAPQSSPFTIGYLARICPEKGLHVLCAAFKLLRRAGRDCRLKIAGYLPPSNQAYLRALLQELRDEPAGTVEYLPDVDRAAKMRLLRSLNVLSVPTVYREAKGLYVLEALAEGVPVVQPDHGAFPEIIAATGGGLLFPPEDAAALAEALSKMMDEPGSQQEMGRRGRSVVLQAYTDQVMAEKTWRLYEQYV
jgi:glycosyltransferase involved in cell wall biosynthesis